jgi:hypothetical protein
MNASAFSTKTTTSQTAYDGIRSLAGVRSGALRAAMIAYTTTVMMPERCSRSAIIHTAHVERNCTMTAVATSLGARSHR